MSDSMRSSCCAASRMTVPAADLLNENGLMSNTTSAASDKMIYLAGGDFFMGTDDQEGFPADGEGPVRKITIAPFYIDPCAVTNEEFLAFVDATGYKTEAENFGWSFVFHLHVSEQ